MLKTTRFCVWSYRWAVPGMMAVIFLISLINLTGSRAREGMTGYITSMGIMYLTLIPFLLSALQMPQTVRFSLTMGQTRRGLWAELPCITLALALFMDAGMCAVFAAQCRHLSWAVAAGRLCAGPVCPAGGGQHCAHIAGPACGPYGPPVRRLGLGVRLCGFAGDYRGGGAGRRVCAPLCAAQPGAAVFEPARAAAAAGASALGALAVCGAVQAASWLLLRRICVK